MKNLVLPTFALVSSHGFLLLDWNCVYVSLIRFTTTDVPELVLSFGPNINRNLIREGSDVYVECHIRSNPFVYDVIWTFKGQQLISNRSEGIIIANQSLVLQNIKRKSSGHYQCSGRNEVGIGLSNELFIRVQCKFVSLSFSEQVANLYSVLFPRSYYVNRNK